MEAPVQVVSHNHSALHYLNDVLLMNVSNQRLTEIQLGWCLTGETSFGQRAVISVGTGRPLAIAIEPGSVAPTGLQPETDLESLLGRMAAHQDIKSFTFEIGVVAARFQNGNFYSYDLERRKEFPKRTDKRISAMVSHALTPDIVKAFSTAADQRAKALLAESGESGDARVSKASFVSRVLFQMYFTCKSTTAAVYCTNQVSSCTSTLCTSPTACPRQICDLQGAPPPQGDPETH